MKREMKDRIVFRMGKHVYLRPILKEDIPHFTRWINDPEVTAFLKMSVPMTPEDELAWFESLQKRKDTDISFAIALTDTDEVIGNMSLVRINHRHGTATTGSMIGSKDCWGKGYGTEAKMLLLEYAFHTLNLRKICSTVYAFNGRSKRCLEKCGYREEARLRDHIYSNGSYHDVFLLAVFREEFEKLWKEYCETTIKK